jgi:hypothetical protein
MRGYGYILGFVAANIEFGPILLYNTDTTR